MAWNKNSYYYQNQMKVLSGSDPTPGYTEDDTSDVPSNIEQRIQKNGLYKFVSLIKAKFEQLRDTNWSLINLKGKGKLGHNKDLNELNGENTYNGGNQDTIGNFYHTYSSTALKDKTAREALHYPSYINTKEYSTVLKVSAPTGSGVKSTIDGNNEYFARQDLLQNMNPNRYVRLHSGSGRTDNVPTLDDNWTEWYVFVPMTEDEAFKIGLIDEHGTPKPWRDIFLRRSNDYTNGPIGFGIDPDSGDDTSKDTKAKIILGEYTYGKNKPSEHYADLDQNIPKGQIYLQYDDSSTES